MPGPERVCDRGIHCIGDGVSVNFLCLHIIHRCLEATHEAGTIMRGVGTRPHGVSMEVL
jgi:hypothetical protein